MNKSDIKKFYDKKIDKKIIENKLLFFEKKFLEQEQFPVFPSPYEDLMIPISFTGNLMFIRSKFLYLGFRNDIENKNLYSAYTSLKAYWENVATFGYYFIKTSNFIEKNNKYEAFELSSKMGLGGRGFLNEEMVKNVGREMEEFKIPKISKMIDVVDKDLGRRFGFKEQIMHKPYGEQIAEGGHTTFIGLSICEIKNKDKSMLPDLNKSWEEEEYKSIINLMAMSSEIFFLYWKEFEELKLNENIKNK